MILFGPMIATSGQLITGVCDTPPKVPSEVRVRVEPVSSSFVAEPSRAALVTRAISAAHP